MEVGSTRGPKKRDTIPIPHYCGKNSGGDGVPLLKLNQVSGTQFLPFFTHQVTTKTHVMQKRILQLKTDSR